VVEQSEPAPQTWAEFAQQMGRRLQRARLAEGMSQEQLAHRCGVTRNHYQLLERGYLRTDQPANPSIKVLVSIAVVLGVEVADLVPDHADLRV
jgi:transcriptional regulator with XRE-family HTH domain